MAVEVLPGRLRAYHGRPEFATGRIEGMEHRAGSQVIKAIVPLPEMFVTRPYRS